MITLTIRAAEDLKKIREIMKNPLQRLASPLNELSKFGLITNRKTLADEMDSLIKEAIQKNDDANLWLFILELTTA